MRTHTLTGGSTSRWHRLWRGPTERPDHELMFNPGCDRLPQNRHREGVDVRGQALNMVVIDKLPFKSPADPLVMARLEYLTKLGENGFTEHQLPEAVLSLKQGVGRLLRDENDYGLIVICDNRINKKSYGSAKGIWISTNRDGIWALQIRSMIPVSGTISSLAGTNMNNS